MLSGVFAMGKFPGGFTSNANDADGSGNPRHHSGRSPMNRSGGGSSSSSATFSNREVDGFHAQGEVAMLDLLEYDGAASYHKISDKDKCVLYECSSSSSTTTTVTEDTYSVKGVHTICTHMSEVMELLSAKSQYFSSVLTKLLGPIHADNSPLFPVDTHSIDEHALLIVYLALQSSSTAAMNNDLASASHFRTKATAAGHITREYCFLRYCGYFTNNNEAGRMERVLPSEPLRPQSQAVSVWDSIASAQSCTPHGPIGRLIKTGFILEQAKAPNAVKVNFIMSMHPHNYANSRQLASEKLFLQRMVRTMLLNVSAAVMELRLLTDHLLLKTSWTDSPMCTICLKNFSLLRRKHHYPQPEPPVDDTSQFLYHSTPFSYPLNFYNGNAWPDAPVTASEDERMERARDLDLLRRRDDILMYVRIAAKTLKCPVATLCIVGGQAGLLIAKVGGVTTDTIPRQVMLESHAILSPEPTVVLDCLSDLRFATNPLVCEGDIGIRFYVGMPLCTSDGLVLGVLSLVDTQPRDRVRIAELQKLRQVTDTVMHRFEDLSVGTTKTRWDQQAAFQRQCEMDLELD
ncbi:hypothetical protein B5M09_003637 [Aphanomyces astaci]|uniref:GAF domain-containing protein n=1 Tax=Aphanomyces astaci TaxID=112090 RepID=A0A3R7WIT3_APHAT|nr:hypothetical protein B5M09_003637 [Aphanomyces astaci]